MARRSGGIGRPLSLRLAVPANTLDASISTKVPFDGYLVNYEVSVPGIDDGDDSYLGVAVYVGSERIIPGDGGELRSPRAREHNGGIKRRVRQGDYIVLWGRNNSTTDAVVTALIELVNDRAVEALKPLALNED